MQGLVKHIGISNFSVKKFEEVLSYARHPVAINQVEIHPYWRNDKLMAFAKSKVRHERPASLQDELGLSATRLNVSKVIATCSQGLHLSAYSPLGSPDSSSSMGNDDKKKLLDDPVVNELAKKYNKSAGQVSATCLGWRQCMSYPRCSACRGCSSAVA